MVDSPEMMALAKAVSRLIGWSYVLCWSLSFYPQPIKNFRRKSTQGLAIDFPTMNLLGFSCYAISTAAFLFSPTIKAQYAHRHPLSPETTVRFNDFAFAAHAVIMCVVGYSQFWPSIWGFNVGLRQRVSRYAIGLVTGSILILMFMIYYISFHTPTGGNDADDWAWIDLIYMFGYVKLMCSVTKYIPQAYANFKRQSTAGWDITQILLDFSGGILSIIQLILDSALQADWSGFVGNPVKLGLSQTSLFFDTIFILQHYILYRSADATFGLGHNDRRHDVDGDRELSL